MTPVSLRSQTRRKANLTAFQQSYDAPSPNEMVVDSSEYVGPDDLSEKEQIAIIEPDPDHEAEPAPDAPRADDCKIPE